MPFAVSLARTFLQACYASLKATRECCTLLLGQLLVERSIIKRVVFSEVVHGRYLYLPQGAKGSMIWGLFDGIVGNQV